MGVQVSQFYEGCGTHTSGLHPQGSSLALFLLLPGPLTSAPGHRLEYLPGVLCWESHKGPLRVGHRVQGSEKGKLGPHTVILPASSTLSPFPTCPLALVQHFISCQGNCQFNTTDQKDIS